MSTISPVVQRFFRGGTKTESNTFDISLGGEYLTNVNRSPLIGRCSAPRHAREHGPGSLRCYHRDRMDSTPVAPLAPGQLIGPYQLVDRIGSGGMGEVWSARDTRLDRMVAVKFASSRFSDRFAREARTIAALNHPGICTLYDVGPTTSSWSSSKEPRSIASSRTWAAPW